ncbi:MAG: hypothetical protein AB8B84_01275 [Granulosicoccus sp.]
MKFAVVVWFSIAQLLVGTHWALAQYEAPISLDAGGLGVEYAQYDSSTTYPRISTVDVDPPLIEHDVTAQAEAGIRQTFVATVVDDGELDNVTFYYRFAGETNFSRFLMTPLSSSSTYIAQVPTDPKLYSAIEYYIQARDVSGNRTVRGYTFSPLVREILQPQSAVSPTAKAAEQAPAIVEESSSGIPKFVYILGGVLLLGLIAGGASGGSSGGGADIVDGEACGADGCRLTITVNRPL